MWTTRLRQWRFACGSIAELLGGEVKVILGRPPPLGRSLRLRADGRDGGATVLGGDDLIAEAHLATVGADVPELASLVQALAAPERYPLYQGHSIPACFPCGPERAAGEGLRIFPGR